MSEWMSAEMWEELTDQRDEEGEAFWSKWGGAADDGEQPRDGVDTVAE